MNDSIDICFRFAEENAEEPSSFPLAPGDHLVGSAEDASVYLPRRGVSRHHVALKVSQRGVLVEDLGSKNGTFLNGRRIEQERLSPGDLLRLGSVSLRLENADPEDVNLGMVFSVGDVVKSRSSVVEHETSLLSMAEGEVLDRDLIYSVGSFFQSLVGTPEADFVAGLRALIRALAGRGAALVEWVDGRAVVQAGVGEMAALPDLATIRAQSRGARQPGLHYFSDPRDSSCQAALIEMEKSSALGLWIWGSQAKPRGVEPLLAVLLQMARHFWPRAMYSPAREVESVGSALMMPDHIVAGESPPMVALYQQMSLLRQGDMSVLIVGETGVGKEHLAQALHRSSRRHQGPFVAVNCAAIPEELLESELFGIGKGVATGVQSRRGRFQEADGGTLFLDEIGDMSPPLQAKLLRVLQEKQLRPLGMPVVSIDVRVVAATNVDLQQRISEGQFRDDLYYRLAGYELEVPPLRRRHEDIPPLIAHFVRRFGAETEKTVRGLSVKALRLLMAYSWPGNVRELENVVRRMVYQCPHGRVMDSEMVPTQIRRTPGPAEDSLSELNPDQMDLDLEKQLRLVEGRWVTAALKKAAGNKTLAAKLLGISRNGLTKRMERLDLQAEDFVP